MEMARTIQIHTYKSRTKKAPHHSYTGLNLRYLQKEWTFEIDPY